MGIDTTSAESWVRWNQKSTYTCIHRITCNRWLCLNKIERNRALHRGRLDIDFVFVSTTASHLPWHRLRNTLTSASRESWHRLRIRFDIVKLKYVPVIWSRTEIIGILQQVLSRLKRYSKRWFFQFELRYAKSQHQRSRVRWFYDDCSSKRWL